MQNLVCLFLLAASASATAREYTDQEISNFPKLFHLDDYERCLAKRDGLYCLGIFDLSPDVQPNPSYDLLKEYSEEFHRHFNRTRIHRGYCVSSRCPNDVGNASTRFERCVDKYARGRALRASINTLQYCQTYTERHTEQPTTTAQRIFLQCVYAIIVINIIGTIYDVYTRDSPDKNQLITAFSILANWRRLTAIDESKNSQLTPLDGCRVVAMAFTTFAHANFLLYDFYILNPEALEKFTQRTDGIYISDGTTSIQALLMLSRFLTGYNLLVSSRKRPLSLSKLPRYIVKRIARISPVLLLVVGFAATWWPYTRDGPLVPTSIGLESSHCQNKFWSHIFYINNMVDRPDICLTPTWFVPVDLHSYILACVLTLFMWRHRCKAVKLYMIMFVVSCVLLGIVAYVNEYKSIVHIFTPELMRGIIKDSPSYTDFYIASWNALPSCLLGLILANVQFECEENRIKLSEHKWFACLHYVAFLLTFLWPLKGMIAREYSSTFFHAVYLALDTPLYCIIVFIFVLGLIHVDGPLRRISSWSGFIIMARMSLIVMLLHWCVSKSILTRPVTYSTSLLDVIVDWTATNAITYMLAIPITVLVEIPVQKFIDLLIF